MEVVKRLFIETVKGNHICSSCYTACYLTRMCEECMQSYIVHVPRLFISWTAEARKPGLPRRSYHLRCKISLGTNNLQVICNSWDSLTYPHLSSRVHCSPEESPGSRLMTVWGRKRQWRLCRSSGLLSRCSLPTFASVRLRVRSLPCSGSWDNL